MLELASQRGFRECGQDHVSTPGIPGNVEGAGFFDFLGSNAHLSERPELAPETERVPVSLESRETGRAWGLVGPRKDASRHHGRLSVLWGTHNSLMQNRLSAITLLGQEAFHHWLPAAEIGSTLVRQLRGPHLRICPWWRRRSSIALTAATSPSSFPQSSTGRFEVSTVLARS